MNLSNEQELRLECVKLLLESFSYYDEKIPVDKRLAVLTYEADELFAFIHDHKLLRNHPLTYYKDNDINCSKNYIFVQWENLFIQEYYYQYGKVLKITILVLLSVVSQAFSFRYGEC